MVQRVAEASVSIDGEIVADIGRGLLVLLGVGAQDGPAAADWLADKLVGLRIFDDDAGRFDRSVQDVGGSVLVVSQFTLYGDTRKGRRPSFSTAAAPDMAERLYSRVVERIEQRGVPTARGRFGAHMQVRLLNDGPVTLVVDADQPQPAVP